VARGCGDRGSSTVEVGLLLAAVVVLLCSTVLSLGVLIRDQLNDTCDQVSATRGARCSSGGPPGGVPGAPGAPGAGPQVLEQAVAQQLAVRDPAGSPPAVRCVPPRPDPPPAGATTTCTVTYSSGATEEVTLEFTDDAGHFTIRT